MALRLRLLAWSGAALLIAGSQAVLGHAAASLAPDGWTAHEITLMKTLHISALADKEPDPSNAYEARQDAAALGKKLFFDQRLSANGRISCASCHSPEQQFQDGRPLGIGIATGKRRTMPVAESGRGAWQFWDGRKDSLWSQALGPMEDAAEHGGNRVAYARVILEHYRRDYEAVFQALPASEGWPLAGGPNGTVAERAAWENLTPLQRQEVSRVFANMGKAIAAYENTLHFAPSRLDNYIGAVTGLPSAAPGVLSSSEKRGLRLFMGKAQCISCHAGPLFTDQHFHNTGVPPRLGSRPDPGRSAAIDTLLRDEFNCLGPYSDARRDQCTELAFLAANDPHMVGAFKTPGLRNAAQRAPYMHAGQMATLEDVVRHYASAPQAVIGRNERQPVQLSASEVSDLASFIHTLDSAIEERAPGTRFPGAFKDR